MATFKEDPPEQNTRGELDLDSLQPDAEVRVPEVSELEPSQTPPCRLALKLDHADLERDVTLGQILTTLRESAQRRPASTLSSDLIAAVHGRLGVEFEPEIAEMLRTFGIEPRS